MIGKCRLCMYLQDLGPNGIEERHPFTPQTNWADPDPHLNFRMSAEIIISESSQALPQTH